MKLQDKNIVITGASRGLGLAIAQRCHDEGANLVLISRTKPDLISKRIRWFKCDLSKEEKTSSVCLRLTTAFPIVHALINNAAIQGQINNTWMLSSKEWHKAIQTNLTAPFQLMRILIPKMKIGSKIINLSGGGAVSPRPMFSPYAVSKTGLVRLSENLAEELKEIGIDVNCVSPGIMYSNMTEETLVAGIDLVGKEEYQKAQRVKERNPSVSSDAINLAMFLLSEESNGITGKTMSAMWDNWEDILRIKQKIIESNVYTLRRLTARDCRGIPNSLDKNYGR